MESEKETIVKLVQEIQALKATVQEHDKRIKRLETDVHGSTLRR